MPYNIEVTFYSGGVNEYTHEDTFSTLENAIRRIETLAKGHMMCRAWINNKRVKVRDGHVIGSDGLPFCSNQKWHDLFAPDNYPKVAL